MLNIIELLLNLNVSRQAVFELLIVRPNTRFMSSISAYELLDSLDILTHTHTAWQTHKWYAFTRARAYDSDRSTVVGL